jgi:hypothetical protein
VLVAFGAPAHLLGIGIAQLVSTAARPIAILGSASVAPASPGPAIGCGTYRPLQISRHVYEYRISESPVANPPSTTYRVQVIIFRVVAALAGLFFVVAVALTASAPWVLLPGTRQCASIDCHRLGLVMIIQTLVASDEMTSKSRFLVVPAGRNEQALAAAAHAREGDRARSGKPSGRSDSGLSQTARPKPYD